MNIVSENNPEELTYQLVSIGQLADRDGYVQTLERRLGLVDLICQFLRRNSIVVQRFRSELNDSSDKFGFRVRLQDAEQGISMGHPDIGVGPSKL